MTQSAVYDADSRGDLWHPASYRSDWISSDHYLIVSSMYAIVKLNRAGSLVSRKHKKIGTLQDG